jgi:carbamate kinase
VTAAPRMRVVAALGGNALLRRDEAPEADVQRRNVDVAVRALAEIARHHDLVVTHGNGPQVGLLALQAAAYPAVAPYPLDVLGAESEGMIGYLLDQGLTNELPGRRVATLLTQVIVDAGDPAFRAPTKFVGPVYEEGEAHALAAQRGWTVRPDGDRWRRVVPSPEPRSIVELSTIRLLADAGVLVVCVGGGGVPVTVATDGALHGAEAVVDKDLAAALLAQGLQADVLLLLTDVQGIELDRGTSHARVLGSATPDEVRDLRLPDGSMGPKAEAAARFAETTGGVAVIASLAAAQDALAGRAGTVVGRGDLLTGSRRDDGFQARPADVGSSRGR